MNFKSISNKKNIVFGIILSFITLLVSLVLHVFYTKFLVDSVGDTQYGVYSYAVSITNWLTVFSSAIFSAYIKFATIKQKESGESGVKTTNSLFLFLFVVFDVVAVVFLSIIFVLLINGVIEYRDKNLLMRLLLISGIQVVLSIPSNIFSLYITFKEKHIWLKFVNLFGTILGPAISIPFLIKGCSIDAVLMIQCLILICTYLLNFSFAIFHLKQSFTIKGFLHDKIFVKQIAVFSFFMILVEVVDKLNATSDQIILGSIAGGRYVELVTVYQLSYSFSEFFASLSSAVVTVFTPTIHKYVTNNEKEKLEMIFIYIYTIQMYVLFLVLGGFLSCGQEFILLWKPEHPEIYLFAAILLFIRIVPLSQNASYEVQKAKNKFYFRCIINFVFAIINVGISIIFLFVLGFENGIYACLIGTIFSTLVSKWFLISRYNRKTIGLNMKKYWFALFEGILVLVFSFLVNAGVKQFLILLGVSTAARLFIIGINFTLLFTLLFFPLFSKDILKMACTLSKRTDSFLMFGEKYMKNGNYKINAALDTFYNKKENAIKVNKNSLSIKGSTFFKILISFFYHNFSHEASRDCCGDVIYRSKNRTHVFDLETKKHFIIFDNKFDLVREVNNRNKKYPYSGPEILFFNEEKHMLCEQLIGFQNPSPAKQFDLICTTLLKQKYKMAEKKKISDYLLTYHFKSAEIGDHIREVILSKADIYPQIALYHVHGDFAPGNVAFLENKIIAIDWEVAGLGPFYYDFIHYLMAIYIRTGDDAELKKFFNGVYDNFLVQLFLTNGETYDPSLKEMYYYICIVTRLILFSQKDGCQFEDMVVKNKMWLNGTEDK